MNYSLRFLSRDVKGLLEVTGLATQLGYGYLIVERLYPNLASFYDKISMDQAETLDGREIIARAALANVKHSGVANTSAILLDDHPDTEDLGGYDCSLSLHTFQAMDSMIRFLKLRSRRSLATKQF